jgi:hypothetical protein
MGATLPILAGLATGLAQGVQNRSEQELKKLMVQKYKTELDLAAKKLKAFENVASGTAGAIDYALLGIDPMQITMSSLVNRMAGQVGDQGEVQSGSTFRLTDVIGELRDLAEKNPFLAGLIDKYTRAYSIIKDFEPVAREKIQIPFEGQPYTAILDQKGRIMSIYPVPPEERRAKQMIQLDTGEGRQQVILDQYGQPLVQYPAPEEFTLEKVTTPTGEQQMIYLPKQPRKGQQPTASRYMLNGETVIADTPDVAAQIERMGGVPLSANTQTESGTVIAPGELDKLVSINELDKWINPATMKPASSEQRPWTLRELMTQGYMRKPEKELSTTDAAKLAAAQQSIKQLNEVLDAIGKDPAMSRKIGFWLQHPRLGELTEGAKYGRMVRAAIEAQLRLASGAAVPEEEVQTYVRTFAGDYLSNPDNARLGLQMLQDRLSGTIKIMDPTGYYTKLLTQSTGQRPPLGSFWK